MIERLLRRLRVYFAVAAIVPKQMLAYRLYFVTQFFVQIISITIFVYFWRAVYASGAEPGGLTLQQTLNYILLAQILVPVVQNRLIFNFGFLIREGDLAIDLTRPIDFQVAFYVRALADLAVSLVLRLPLLLLAILVFGLQLPAQPGTWLAFIVALVLGHGVLFFFDWTFSCLAFYTTETWGLSVVREGVAAFFAGAFLPLMMMPGWLQSIALALPFAQALYVPVSFLSGITPASAALQVWAVQLAWLLGLGVLSRLVFSAAVRVVTVQGG